MKELIWSSVLVLGLMLASSAGAQQPSEGGEADKADKAGKPEAEATKPADKVDETEEVIFERLTGLYFEGRGGMFFTIGGARGYSNGMPFFGFEIGYDVLDTLSIQLGYASGFQSANPLVFPEECTGPDCGDYHLDFGMTFINLSLDYDVLSYRRWALELRAGGGIVLIEPSAEPGQGPVDGDAFGGLRFEYYTLLKHFTLGLEFDFIYIIPTGIPCMAVSLSVLYNF